MLFDPWLLGLLASAVSIVAFSAYRALDIDKLPKSEISQRMNSTFFVYECERG